MKNLERGRTATSPIYLSLVDLFCSPMQCTCVEQFLDTERRFWFDEKAGKFSNR